jgi:hypothetical protein
MEIALLSDRYATPPSREVFYRNAFAALAACPEVAVVSGWMPLTGNNWTVLFQRPTPLLPGSRADVAGRRPRVGSSRRSRFRPSGRLSDERDGPSAPPVVIVSRR